MASPRPSLAFLRPCSVRLKSPFYRRSETETIIRTTPLPRSFLEAPDALRVHSFQKAVFDLPELSYFTEIHITKDASRVLVGPWPYWCAQRSGGGVVASLGRTDPIQVAKHDSIAACIGGCTVTYMTPW